MTAPSIQLAPSVSAETIASSVHAFETSISAGASFAEHLDRAVQATPRPASRPETQPSGLRSAMPKQTAEATQAPRTQAAAARPTASQTKQNSGPSVKNRNSSKAQNSEPSPVQKDGQRQPTGLPSRDSRLSDNSRNSGRRQPRDEENSASSKSPFAQAVAQSAASQSEASSATQPAETGAQPSDASIPAALLALLQAAQNLPASDNDPNALQTDPTDSSSTDPVSAAPGNLFQSLSFSTSNAAYQAALANFQTLASAAQSSSSNGTASASQPIAPGSESATASTESSTSATQATSGNSNPVPPSASLPRVNAPAVSTDSTTNAVTAAASASAAALASTVVPTNHANAAASAAHASPSTNGQQADTNPAPAAKPSSQVEAAEPANVIKNLKSDAGQHEAAKPLPPLDQLTTAAKAKAEPVAAELQQVVTSVTVTNHASLTAFSRQAGATDSQYMTAGQDSGSQAVSATQGAASGWTGDSTEDDYSPQAGNTSQGSNSSKSSGSGAEFLPSAAFSNDAVSGVAPAAVHAVAAGTLQSNTGFDNASLKTPEATAQNLNSAAQEKAFAAWQSVSAQIGRVVNTAALNALQNGTEMRVQLRTDAFGSMDIRATLEGGKVGAAIGVESAEAHNALLSQLPALQQSLNERQVPLDQISVVSSYGQSETGFGTGSGNQNGDPTPSGGYRQQASGPDHVSEPVSAPVTEAWQPATSRGRLSVRA